MNNSVRVSVLKMGAEVPPESKSVKRRGAQYVWWGDNNEYPLFLWNLYTNCAEHQAIIDGACMYILGNGIATTSPRLSRLFLKMNNKGETIMQVLYRFLLDVKIYGGACLQRIYNTYGELTEVYNLDISNCRFDETVSYCFYKKDWNSRAEAFVLPVNTKDRSVQSDVYYYRGKKTRDVYPIPEYEAAIKAIMILVEINNFHLNNIANGFAPSTLIQFNNGEPEEDVKRNIEREIERKFVGSNGKKFLLLWNNNKDTAATIEKLEPESFAEQYDVLYKTSQNTIFVAHKVTSPALFGIKMENTGLSKAEYAETFEIYNSTIVRHDQQILLDVLRDVFRPYEPNADITITPYQLFNL